MHRARALVVYPFLHHYRRGVFLELDRTTTIGFTFAADIIGHAGIKTMDSAELQRFVRVRTRRWKGFEWQWKVLHIVITQKWDVVIFLGDISSVSTWVAALVARFRKAKVYFWTIGWHRPERGAKRIIRVAFYKLAHGLLLYGEIGRRIGYDLGYPAHRMSVIGNSISSPPDNYSPTGFTLPTRSREVLSLGAVARLTDVKRFDILIDAAAILRGHDVDVRVHLAGEGAASAMLCERAVANGVALQIHPPIYTASDLQSFYRAIDITVVPRAIGLTAIQSLSYGVPAVSDDDVFAQMPEWEAIIPGRTGATYAKHDAGSLAEAILWVATLVRGDGATMAEQCESEYRSRWSPGVHATNIIRSLTTG